MKATSLIETTCVYKVKLVSLPTLNNAYYIEKCREINDTEFKGCEAVQWENSYIWAAMKDKTVVGFATMRYLRDEKVGFLSRALVLPEHRRKGIHTRLLKARVRMAKKKGWQGLLTYVSVTNPASANSLFQNGFKMYIPEFRWAGKDFLYLMRKFNGKQ